MRPTLLSASLLLLGSAQGQFVEVADQRTDRVQYTHITPMGADTWVVLGWADRDFALGIGGNFVCARNGNGALLWNTEVSMLTSSWGQDVAQADMEVHGDSAILVAGRWDQCDVIGQESSVMLLNATGQVVWESIINTGDAALRLVAADAVSRYAVASSERVYLLDLAGDSATSWVPDHLPINDLVWESDTTILVLSDTVLARYDFSGTLLVTESYSGLGIALMTHNNLALVLTETHIHSIDLNNLQVDHDLSAYPGAPIQLIGSDDGPKILTTCALIDLGDNHTPATHLEFELLPDQSIRDATWSNDIACTVSNVQSTGNRSGLMRTYTSEGTSVLDEDVSVTVQVDSAWFEPRFNPVQEDIYDVLISPSAVVTNNGTTVVNELLVFFQSPFAVSYCNTAAINLSFADLGIQPGESVVIPFGPQLWIIVSSEPGASFNGTLCVSALSPNEKVDRVPEDNRGCEDFVIVNTVGINDYSKESVITVFPNPFTDQLIVQSTNSRALSIRMFDATGRLVHSARLSASGTLSVPELANGVYVIDVTDGEHYWRRSLVKADR